jgi:HK97 gp10 family phage protein
MAEDGVTIDIQGLAELQATLTDLSTRAADKAMRNALKAGAAIEQASISTAAPIKVGSGGILPDGALKNDIVIKIKKDDRGGMTAVVGPDKYTAHVARWVEYGHRLVRGGYSRMLANGKTRGPGKEVDQVEEHPFIRPAWEASREAVTTAITTTLASEIEQAAARKGRSK